jgi:uracil DNA glycosylase
MEFHFKDKTIQIDDTWEGFFKTQIEELKIISDLLGNKFVPKEPSDIFVIFSLPKPDIKFVIIGKDPYPKTDEATGRSFERELDSWSNVNNPSLQAILASIYYKNQGDLISFEEVIQKIGKNAWYIDPPNKLFKRWEKEKGVFCLNKSLTHGSDNSDHLVIWRNFIEALIRELCSKDEICWLLWGAEARELENIIKTTSLIEKADHPAYWSYETLQLIRKEKFKRFVKTSGLNRIIGLQENLR